MENKFPFTSYDFWAYLSSGFLFLFVADLVAGTNLFARESWTVVQSAVAVSAAYSVGQVLASIASVVFESILVGKLLGYPRDVLFGQHKAAKWARVLLPGYFISLPDQTKQGALEKGKSTGITGPGEALFWMAYANARATPVVMAKLDNFLNLYGFCRNTALVAFLDAGLLYWSYRSGNGPASYFYWAWAALVIGVGMTFRYLKFYRNYGVEVFTSFAHTKE